MRVPSLLLPLAAILLSAHAAAFQVRELVAHWDFAESSGAVLHDRSGHGMDVTLQGTPQLGQPGAAPLSGNSAEFDASLGQYGVLQASLPLDSLVESLSVAAWVRSNSGWASSTSRRILGGQGAGWSCGTNPNGLRFTTIGVQDFDVPVQYPTGPWFHVVFVFTSSHDVRVFLDGSLVGTVAGSAPAMAGASAWLLGSWDQTSEFWDGALDDVQVYAGELLPADVSFLRANPGATVAPAGASPYCFGDGSGSLCPCGNPGASGEGCANSTGRGARLLASGTASTTADDMLLTVDQLPAGSIALLFAGHATPPAPFLGDGLRCAGNQAQRLGVRLASAQASAQWGPLLGVTGHWSSGQQRYFQVGYTDPIGSPCGTGFNLSPALSILFTP